MKQVELNATTRATRGDGPARRLRQAGQVPAVLYGPGAETQHLAVNIRELEHAVQGGSIRRTIFALSIENGGNATKLTVIKDLQTDPITGCFLHVDFYEIDMNRKLRVMVPVVPRGKSKGEEFGGMLQIIEREIEILCLPREIPESLDLDVSELGMGSALHVRDIPLPAGVELPPGENYTVVTVVSPKAEAAPSAVPAGAGEEAAEAEKPAEGEGGAPAE